MEFFEHGFNFFDGDRTPFNAKTTMEWVLPPGVTVISRMDLLKYILTCNPKTKRDSVIGEYIGQIKSLAPAVYNTFEDFEFVVISFNQSRAY